MHSQRGRWERENSFAGQYQQNPAPIGGGIFKVSWWRYYRELPRIKTVFQVADTALKAGESNDYSVIATWGKGEDGNLYLIDLFRGKQESPELRRSFVSQYYKHKPQVIFIEDKASGTTLIQELRATERLPIKAIARNAGGGDKVTRAHDAAPFIESGYVFLPEYGAFTADFVAEHSAFPNSTNDDQVDTTCDAVVIGLKTRSTAPSRLSGRA